MSDDRKWWPECLIDEGMPGGRAKPEDWLSPDDNGVTVVRWSDAPEAKEAGRIAPGRETSFCWFEPRGYVDVTIMPDGSWRHDDTRDPLTPDMFTGEKLADRANWAAIADANAFWIPGDPETFADNLDEFASCYAEFDRPDPDGEPVTVALGFWTYKVRFRVSADGKKLEAIDG